MTVTKEDRRAVDYLLRNKVIFASHQTHDYEVGYYLGFRFRLNLMPLDGRRKLEDRVLRALLMTVHPRKQTISRAELNVFAHATEIIVLWLEDSGRRHVPLGPLRLNRAAMEHDT